MSSKESCANIILQDQMNFLKGYKDCFSTELPDELPPMRGDDDHRIDLIPGSSTPNRAPYLVSYAQQEEILTEVNELLEKGMIDPSSSPFCSPVLLVQDPPQDNLLMNHELHCTTLCQY